MIEKKLLFQTFIQAWKTQSRNSFFIFLFKNCKPPYVFHLELAEQLLLHETIEIQNV